MRWTGLLLALIATLGSAVATRADDLMDLYAMAQANDPTFQGARYTLQAAKEKRPEAFSALLPVISANGSANRTVGDTLYTGTPEISRQFNGDQWVLQLTQPVFHADNILAYDEARAEVTQAMAVYANAEQDLMLRLSRAYFDEIVAERHLTAARAQIQSLDEQLDATNHSFRSGVASITDVDDTRSRMAQAQAQQVGAMNDLQASQAALEAIIGVPPPPLAPLREDAKVPEPSPSDVGSWVAQASTDNLQVKAAQAAQRVAGFELDRSRAARLPTIDIVAGYGGNYSAGNITEPENFGTQVHDKQISIQFNLPLVDGGGMHAQVVEARALNNKAAQDVIAAQRQAVLDARQAYLALMSGRAQVDALQTAVEAGQSALKGNRLGYGLGIRINSDVLGAEEQLYGSVRDLDKARYDALYESLKLKAATGGLSEEDLMKVNALLMPAGATVHPAQSPAKSTIP